MVGTNISAATACGGRMFCSGVMAGGEAAINKIH